MLRLLRAPENHCQLYRIHEFLGGSNKGNWGREIGWPSSRNISMCQEPLGVSYLSNAAKASLISVDNYLHTPTMPPGPRHTDHTYIPYLLKINTQTMPIDLTAIGQR